MNNQLKTAVVTFSFVITLAGCNQSPPKCSEEATLDLVRKIIIDQIGGSEGISESELDKNFTFEFPRATAEDKNIKKLSCDAKVIIAKSYQLPITYESQLDDKNQHLVSVGGVAVTDLRQIKLALTRSIGAERQAIAASAAKPTVSVPVPENSTATVTNNNENGKAKKKLSEAAIQAISEGFVDIKDPAVQSCVDTKITDMRKEIGEDTPINYDTFNEIAVECGFNI